MTTWLPIPGHPDYEVSDDGQVRLWRPWRGLAVPRAVAQHVNAKGYATLHLDKTTHRVHRLVLTAFVGPCPEGMEACHNDGDKLNNRLDNLRWDTRDANRADSYAHGTHPAVNKASRCCNGHEFTPENTRPQRKTTRDGQEYVYRVCLTCQRDRMERFLARRRRDDAA